MKDDELSALLGEMLSRVTGDWGDELSSNREAALDYYFQRNTIPAPEGRSQVVGGVISSMTDAVLAQMLNAFTTENAVSFDPVGPDDDEAAALESQVVNDFVMSRNRGYYNFSTTIKDALLSRNSILKVYLDEKTDIKTDRYKDLDAIEMQQAVQPTAENQTVEIVDFDRDGTLTVKRTTTSRELVIDPVPPENFNVARNWHSIYLDDCPFVAERKTFLRAELLEMGYPKKKVEQLPTADAGSWGDVTARNPGQDSDYPDGVQAATDRCQVWECYAQLDMFGNGKTELMRVMYAAWPDGGIVLEKEPATHIPYACGTAFPISHRWLGLSLFDKLKSNDDLTTSIKRSWADSMAQATTPRAQAVEGQVNMDDALNMRRDGVVRVRSQGAYTPIPTIDVGPSCQLYMNMLGEERDQLGGASLSMASGEMQVTAQIGSQGLDRSYSAKEQLAAMMCRNLAETLIAQTYILTHRALRQGWGEPVAYNFGGQWQEIDPTQWPEREKVTVKLGLSTGERRRKVEALGFIIQQQKELMAAGMAGTMVTPATLRNAILDWGRAAEIDNPEQYFIDPASPEAQQAAQQQQAQAQQQEQKQLLLIQEQFAIEREKNQTEIRKQMQEFVAKQAELQHDYFSDVLKSEVEIAKIVGTSTPDVEREQDAGNERAGV